MEFNYNNKNQTIMGIHVKETEAYRDIKDAILFNVYEGWQPTLQDVKRAINDYFHPSEFSKKSFEKVYGNTKNWK